MTVVRGVRTWCQVMCINWAGSVTVGEAFNARFVGDSCSSERRWSYWWRLKVENIGLGGGIFRPFGGIQ